MDPMVSVVKVNTDTFTLLSVEFYGKVEQILGVLQENSIKDNETRCSSSLNGWQTARPLDSD